MDATIYDVSEVKPVECAAEVNSFSTVVLMEFNLRGNSTAPTADELSTIETVFVSSFNLLARQAFLVSILSYVHVIIYFDEI